MKHLDSLLDKRFLYIHAPAGFGKTMTALLWLEYRAKKAALKRAWINLDDHDNKSAEFCKRFVTALVALQPDNPALRESHSHPLFGNAPTEFTLHAIDTLLPCPEPCVFILDDLHVITNDEILTLLPTICQKLPPRCQVLLLSRNTMPDSMTQMAANNEVALIDGENLRFSGDEIRAFFSNNGRPISAKQAAEILTSTGGWPIGIRALLLSGEKSYRMTLTDKYLENFLRTHVWDRWDEPLKRFMLCVSVVNEMTPPLCAWLIAEDKLLKKADDDGIRDGLAWLTRENAFIRETDSGTYRFHDLFRDFLYRMLAEEGGEIKNRQLIRAGEWFYRQKDHYRAVDYFLKSGHISGIAKALKLMYDNSSAHPLIEDSLEMIRTSLNSAVLERYPFLQELQIWLAYMDGRGEELEAHIDRYMKQIARITIQNPSSLLTSAVVRCVDYRNSLIAVTKKLSKLPPLRFNQDNTPPITQSLPLFHRSGRDFSEYVHDTDKNVRLLSKTLSAVVGDAATVIESLLRGGLAYEQGDLAAAHQLALKALDDMADDLAPEFKFSAHMLLAHVLDGLGDLAGRKIALGRVEKMIASDRAYFVYDNFRAYKCRLQLADGDAKAASEWLARHAASPYDSLPFYKIYQHFVTARALIAVGDYARAVLFLKKLLLLSERFRRPLDIIEAKILLALAYWKRGLNTNSTALLYMGEAAALADQYGYTQIFVADATDLPHILHRLQKRAVSQAGTDLVFTDKQKTVMAFMCEGLSRSDIAQRMGITPNSVKTHLELIYRKLGVTSSIDAVVKYKELGGK